MITVEHLTKSYGTVAAVTDLSMRIPGGSIFAFLGRNGAGKTTTISCMIANLGFDGGTIAINGHVVGQDDELIRRDIGVVFQESLMDPLMTPIENLRVRAGLYGLGAGAKMRIAEVCELVDIGEFATRPYKALSGGERRRVDVARALLHGPSVLFLDEPTAGLDPQSRARVWSAIASLRAEHGLTVFLTTHYMEETENADAVVVVDGGRKIAEGTPHALRTEYSRSILTLKTADLRKTAGALSAAGRKTTVSAGAVEVEVADSQDALRLIDEYRHTIKDFELRHGTMDDVFLSLTESR